MAVSPSPIAALAQAYAGRHTTPAAVLEQCLAQCNSNAGRNVYLAQNAEWPRAEVAALKEEHRGAQPLWGIPVSLKDCFDLAGFRTSCGSRFYAGEHGIAAHDSEVARRLRAAGAVLTGKTHLHMLAYGITGENRDYGDCTQPRDAALLTGGSSSGAAASVQEGSALAAIGTDTGGSIRVPAALCGLAGYRSSLQVSHGLWRGGAHLAPSFDTLGWLYRDLRDGPLLGSALFGYASTPAPALQGLRIGVPHAQFLRDAEPEILDLLTAWRTRLADEGAAVSEFDATWWETAMNIFAPIQAHEAAEIHRRDFDQFEPAIADRLAWGASLGGDEIAILRIQLAAFRTQMENLLTRFEYLLLPALPVGALHAGADNGHTRPRILRYTLPVSLAGTPAITMPGAVGGVVMTGRSGDDARLLALTAKLGELTLTSGNATLHP